MFKSGVPNLPALALTDDVSLQTDIFDVLSFVLIFFFNSLAKRQLLGEVSQKEE